MHAYWRVASARQQPRQPPWTHKGSRHLHRRCRAPHRRLTHLPNYHRRRCQAPHRLTYLFNYLVVTLTKTRCPLPLPSRGHLQGSTHTHRLGNRRIGPMIPPRGQQGPVGSFRARRPCTGTAARVTLSDFPSNVEVSQEVKLFSSQLLHVCYRSHPLHRRPLCGVCVFYYCRTYYKAVRVGGGGEWRTCAIRDDEPRPVWMSLLITH